MTALLTASLRNRQLVLILFLGLPGSDLFGFFALNIEAYPDLVPPLVDVTTQSPGQSAEEIERYITIPIEIEMAGISACHGHSHHLALRSLRPQGAVHLRLHL